MPNGRPPKPLELKQLTGTYRPGRTVDGSGLLTNTEAIKPEAPETLSTAGLSLWEQLWAVNWVSPKSDYQLAVITCQTADEREQVRAALAENPQDRIARISLRELDKQLISLLAQFGFSPADRQRLGVTEIKAKSKLQEILDAKAAAGK